MRQNRKLLLIAGGIIGLLLIWCAVSYNKLVKADERVSQQWSEVQNVYQRRLDLIPNLVSIVRGGAEFETNVLTEVTEARAKAASVIVSQPNDSTSAAAQTAHQNEVARAANNVIARIERYPELKGTEAFSKLQTNLERTELRIKVARRDYNEAVQEYNQSVRAFPASIFASMFGFKAKTGFTADTDRVTEIKF